MTRLQCGRLIAHFIFLSIFCSVLHAFQLPEKGNNRNNELTGQLGGDQDSNEENTEDVPDGAVEESIFQVIFESSPNARTMRAQLEYLTQRVDDFFDCARENRIRIRQYGRLMPIINGFYIRTAPIVRNIDLLEECEYVESITQDQEIQAHAPDVLTSSFLKFFKAQMKTEFQSILGYTGRGVKVGFLDTGIDFIDPLFWTSKKPCFYLGSKECKVEKSVDFVRYFKKLRATTLKIPYQIENSTSVPYSNHGTVMAALITGHTAVSSGIAPLIRVFDYRVLDPNSINTLSVVIHGIQMALDDNIQILCLALGTSSSSFLSHVLKGPLFNAKGEVVTVVTSMGDSKSTALFQTNTLGTSSYALSVGSVQSPTSPCMSAWFLPTQAPYWICFPKGGPFFPTLDSLSKSFFVFAHPEEELYSLPPTIDLKNTLFIFLVPPTVDALIYLASFMPWAMVVCDATVPLFTDWLPSSILFGYFPLKDQHVRLLNELVFSYPSFVEHKTNFTFQVHTPFTSMPSTIQSQGPTLDDEIKPDVVLSPFPLLSTDPLFYTQLESDFPNVFPTSFSAAFLTGLAALYKEARPNDTSSTFTHLPRNTARFYEVIMNTALPMSIQEGHPILHQQPELKGFYFPVTQQGAGTVHLPLFLTTKVAVTPSKLNLGPFVLEPNVTSIQSKLVRLELFNAGPTTILYRLYHRPSACLTMKSNLYQSKLEVFFLNQDASLISLDKETYGTFILKKNRSTTIHLQFKVPTSWTAREHSLFSGYLQLVPMAYGPNTTSIFNPSFYPVLHVPYLAAVYPSEKPFPYFDWTHWWDGFEYKRIASNLASSDHSFFSSSMELKSKLFPHSTTSPSFSTPLTYYGSIQPTPLTSQEVFDQRSVPSSLPLKKMRWPCFTFHLVYPLHQIRVYLYSHSTSKLLGFIGIYHQVESGVHALPFHFSSNQTKIWGWQGHYYDPTSSKKATEAVEGFYYICFEFLKSKSRSSSSTPFPQSCSPSFRFDPSTPILAM